MNTAIKTQIVESAIDIMRNALKRLSDKNDCDAKNIQLVIKFNGEQVLYSYMKDYQKISDLTFNQILDVKFDFKQREFLTAPFLQKSIVRLADEKNTDVNEMSSVIVTKDSDADKVYILAYHNNEFFKQVSFNWLFNNPEEVLGQVE
jgi:hypothetical protein|tara:strand:+ start:2578 stop:3018 length:441 start_codon:yes stop_codon:yes gene_type:complete